MIKEMFKDAIRPAWVEVNLSNLDYNIKQIRKKIGADKEIIGVIKADAYGHGAPACAQVLRDNGVTIFAVATLREAVTLREHGAKEEIIILGLTPDFYVDTLAEYDLTPVVCSLDNAKAIDKAAASSGKTLDALLAIDTGMGRIGYLADEFQAALPEIKGMCELKNFRLKGLFSHMATADAADKSFSHLQEEKYNRFYSYLEENGIKLPKRTLANSASIMEIPDVYFDAVRPGIILYGCYPSHEVIKENLDIKPVMSVKAAIVHLKDVPVGFSCGYGRKFIAERPSKIATLALGYADGYPRPYSAQANVIVNGVICPVAGNICMDQCMVDVTDVPDVKINDEVIVMGSDGTNTILADDIADATGTINYEITCAFGQRLPKVYVK
ncbi:MAG: alanine racemase [Clostridiales bacterium]|nr:alanine racemase [Clostridiales bacterium]MDD7347717.1 alanine racemase [Clostridiales bacterium]